jgi:hypothetical protein
MPTAGRASLFHIFDMVHGKTPLSRKSPRTFIEGDAGEVHTAIERGMDGLGKSKENKARETQLGGERGGGDLLFANHPNLPIIRGTTVDPASGRSCVSWNACKGSERRDGDHPSNPRAGSRLKDHRI